MFVAPPSPLALTSGSSFYGLQSSFSVSQPTHRPSAHTGSVPSLRFLAPSRDQHPGFAVTSGSTPPPPSVPRFFQPLDGLLPKTPCGLISSHSHVQASPSRVFPSFGVDPAHHRILPSCGYRRRTSPFPVRPACDSASGLSSPHESVAPIPQLSSFGARYPPGLSPLQGLLSLAVAPSSGGLPSRACKTTRTRRPLVTPQGLAGPENRFTSCEVTSPLEVLGLLESSHVQNRTRSGLSFRLGADAASPLRRLPL